MYTHGRRLPPKTVHSVTQPSLLIPTIGTPVPATNVVRFPSSHGRPRELGDYVPRVSCSGVVYSMSPDRPSGAGSGGMSLRLLLRSRSGRAGCVIWVFARRGDPNTLHRRTFLEGADFLSGLFCSIKGTKVDGCHALLRYHTPPSSRHHITIKDAQSLEPLA